MNGYLVTAVVAGIAAPWALYRFLANLRRGQLFTDTPRVRIRSAAQGYVKIAGRATPSGSIPLLAPLTSRPCVWWRYSIEQKVRNSKNESHWESIDSGSSVELIGLKDEDAQCLVGPVSAEITPTTHDVWYGALPRPMGPPDGSHGLFGVGDYRYTESLLSVGDRLSVLGELRSHSEVGGTDDAAANLLKHWKQDQRTLLMRFDRNHDGRIDSAEWDAARQAATDESSSRTLQTPITRVSVIEQPTNGEPFLICALDDAHVVRREKLHAGLFFCLGLISMVLCAWGIEHAHSASSMLTVNRNSYGLLVTAAFALGPSAFVLVSRMLNNKIL
jgi:E3 Ubiquitin ligase